VEADRPGFERGRKLDKLGLRASDTSELFFSNLRVPATNRVGEEGAGFAIMMDELPRERLTVAFRALGEAQRAFDLTLAYVKERKAFGQTLFDFQNTQFKLAEMKTSLAVGWAFLDQCLQKITQERLGLEEGAMAKLWAREYPISRLFVDARVRRIYGGTSEIMKLLISRCL